ncbi:microfibril-associated glycoprotein 4-like [Amphiura filiformis]|uniref:microfibril-associated glycoprotein 4-like n=1 Tax=Amphiura filiformis TaxID=82378 RepID=UPI003B20CB94
MGQVRAWKLMLLVHVIFGLIEYSSTQDPICGKQRQSDASCSPNYSLTGATHLLSTQISSKRKCYNLCLHDIGCKSVNFNAGTQECILLGSNRIDLPVNNFVQTTNIHYCEINTKEQLNYRANIAACQPTGVDCAEIYSKQFLSNGVYSISPAFLGASLDVMCDMDNGGWTVIIQRLGTAGSTSFNRDRASYKQGFGNPDSDYWLGLDNIYGFTNDGGTWKLRIDLEDWHGNTGWAEYSSFQLTDPVMYTISVTGYTGNIGDSLTYHNGMDFSTYDDDRDRSGRSNCALDTQSGWWFNKCTYANLNGVHYSGYLVPFNEGIQWETWTTNHPDKDMNEYSMKSASMKIKKV